MHTVCTSGLAYLDESFCTLPCCAWTKMANFAVILQISRSRWMPCDLVVLHCVGWTSTTRRRRWWLLWLLQCRSNELWFESDPIHRYIVRFPRSWWKAPPSFTDLAVAFPTQVNFQKIQDFFCVSGRHLEDQLCGSVANYNDVSWVQSWRFAVYICSCDSCAVVHCIDLVAFVL